MLQDHLLSFGTGRGKIVFVDMRKWEPLQLDGEPPRWQALQGAIKGVMGHVVLLPRVGLQVHPCSPMCHVLLAHDWPIEGLARKRSRHWAWMHFDIF